ncbi:hypothetical protein [Actinoplanes flavus]|uniref:Uncharacterized protein n=1 Tax=Actinoplanes flavus TaxID=2820290 RepID=A0ABS3UGT6_9ACTN|nr:hypothetical protein [Actinoplanes flavus]MBO3737990.1 hypothetical protein [Actinoplanes flavus]
MADDNPVINQTGAGETQYNVAGNVDARKTINHHHYGTGPDAAQDAGEAAESSSGSGAAVATGSGGIALAAVAAIGYMIFGQGEPFPATSDPWPAGADEKAVVAAAGEWLANCEKSDAASPANCPQSVIEPLGTPSKVHWEFYGSPLESAVIRYSEADSRFDMLGTMVVSGDYMVANQPRRAVNLMTYWAKVKWLDGKLDVEEIKSHSALGDPEVAKRALDQPWEPVAAKLNAAFTRCVSGTASAMPAGCPDRQLPEDAKKIKWALAGDPLLTARASFDPKFGILRVKGTYGMTMNYRSLGVGESESHNANYEALVASTANGPAVLQIKETV